MELLQDGILAFLCAVGLTACVWLVAGSLLTGKCRNGQVRLVLPLEGEAPAMESDLRDLLRTRHTLPLATIVLVDCGMTPEARRMAEFLAARHQRVELTAAGEVTVA